MRTAQARARAACVLDALPEGLATRLGRSYTDGAELSGGQRQKLALGRAFMRDWLLLLVLDEPAAALDAEAEHAPFFQHYAAQAERPAADGGITLLVSHGFSTAGMADLIVVVEGSRIAEVGDRAGLLRRGGLYAEVYTLQAYGYR